jgi:uncharacterized hydrophobic protein (TIGR00271 family)
VPLLRITCPPEHTQRLVALLHERAEACDVSVVPGARAGRGDDLIVVEVPRHIVDDIIDRLPAHAAGMDDLHVSISPSVPLYPRDEDTQADNEAVVWAQVHHEIAGMGRLSWVNTLLVVIAAAIAAVGIIQDQLLLLVGAMALSPDYYPVALTCLAVVERDRRAVRSGLRTLAVVYMAGAAGALVLSQLLVWLGIVNATNVPSQQFTLFISEPNALSVVVALLAGVAGALGVTLADARGLVGVFVSVTTIPAAANIGVAVVARDPAEAAGAAVQLAANVVSLLLAGTITLALRRWLPERLAARAGRG